MSADPSFAEFLAQLRQGDDQAARLLVERFGQRLLARAQHKLDTRLRGKVEAEDVVQSAFKSVCQRLREGRFQLDDWDSLQALLITVTYRKCGRWRDYYHTRQRDVTREQPLARHADDTQVPNEPAAPEHDPAADLILEETATAMVHGLRHDEREFVRLRLDGYDIREISDLCHSSYDRVWRTLRLVKNRLQRLLDANDDSRGDPPRSDHGR